METRRPIANPWPGAPVIVKESTSSTMDDAHELALAGCPTGAVVVAGFQEKGRGRVPGRTWISPASQSLLATVVVRIADLGFPLRELPLRAGVAVALAVEECADISTLIKWPNDLIHDGKKLAGILCEARGGAALIGVGVNLAQTAFPKDLAGSACSLLQASGRDVPVFTLLAAVLDRLKDLLADHGWLEKLLARLHRKGGEVSVDAPGSGLMVQGTLIGVDEQCRLVVRLPTGALVMIAQGEIRTGP